MGEMEVECSCHRNTILIFKTYKFNVSSSSFFYSLVMGGGGTHCSCLYIISLYSIEILSVVLDIVQVQDVGLG